MGAFDIAVPGQYDIAEDEYHADPVRHLGGSLSSTVARKLLAPSCPALAKWAADHPEHKDTYDLGTVTHRLTLGSGPRIVKVPADNWMTKAAKEARDAARAEGAVPLLSKDLARATAMRDAVHAEPLAHALLTMPGQPEQTLLWQEAGTWCRAMLDRWPHPDNDPQPIIVDLKKTAKALDDASLAKTVWEYGYHQQADWYSRGYLAVHDVRPDFVFVFVQDSPPHLVRVVTLDLDLLADALARNDEALQIWRQCQETGVWPAYENTLDPLSAPRWANLRETYA